MFKQLSLSAAAQINAELKQKRMAQSLSRPVGYFYKAPGSKARSYIPQKYA